MQGYERVAKANLTALEANHYPGRGIIIGLDPSGEKIIQVYWIMGRSAGSRNRVFDVDAAAGRVSVVAADPRQSVGDPELTTYNAMLEGGGRFVVSNGRQTDTLQKLLESNSTFTGVLRNWRYEPDAPNYTPRIAAVWTRGWGCVQMAIIRKSPWGEQADRSFFEPALPAAGYGYMLTTYERDGDPLPPFYGEPRLVPLPSTIYTMVPEIMGWLNKDNLVALAVKEIDCASGASAVRYYNKYEKVAA